MGSIHLTTISAGNNRSIRRDFRKSMNSRRRRNVRSGTRKSGSPEEHIAMSCYLNGGGIINYNFSRQSSQGESCSPVCIAFHLRTMKKGCGSVPLRRNHLNNFVPDLAKRSSINSNSERKRFTVRKIDNDRFVCILNPQGGGQQIGCGGY